MLKNISGKYQIEITQIKYTPVKLDEKLYLAKITRGKDRYITQGNYDDIFYMIGDCLATVYDVKIPAWKRFLIKLFNL